MILKEYASNFVGYDIPIILVELLAFENECGNNAYFSEGFELIVDDKSGLTTWSDNPNFLRQLIPFAQADGTGSFYALWANGNKNLSQAPIIVFGSEGSFYIVANNLLEFLELISLDVEPIVDNDGVYYSKDDANYEQSPNLRKYKKWLRLHYHVSSISNNFAAEEIVDYAQNAYQEPFWIWTSQFIPETHMY
jgi:hypothetical protein